MKTWIISLALFATGHAVAQTHDGGLQSLLSQHWEKIATSGADTYAFNSENVLYDQSGARVAIRTMTKLASGSEKLHIDIGTLPCGRNTSIPSHFMHEDDIDLIVEPSGRARIDPQMSGSSGMPIAIDIETGSVLAAVAKSVCLAPKA